MRQETHIIVFPLPFLQVFVVTNYWEHLDGAREERQGKAIMDAAVTAGVRQIVFSGLPSPQELHGIKGVHHLEHKAVLEKYLLSDACAAVPFRTVARIAYYYQNQLSFFPPRKGEDGSYTISVPMGDKPLKAVDVNDYGQLVAAVFAQPEKYAGKTVNAVGDYQPVSHICEEISKAVGVKVSYYPVEVETFASWGFPGAEDLANMFAFNQKDPWNAQAGVEDDALREEYPAAKTWAQWVQQPEVVAQLRKAMGL